MPAGGKPIEPSLIARLTGAVRAAVRGASEAWFGPSQPLPPVAPEEARGRAYDYPVAVNTVSRPRGEQGESTIDFSTLRLLADPAMGGFDLLRLAIETRKDQMEGQRWVLSGRDGTDGGTKARELEKLLRFPDGVHTFAQWQRMLLEDLLVIDAPSVYFAPTTGAYRIPEIIDGGTLKRLIRGDGRTPLPPDPAFQQVIHGLPATNYTLDELLQLPRNMRSHRIYGFSPVEQVIATVNIALRRQMYQLEHYTAGSIPDAVASVPPEWTPDQVRQFQEWWDSIFSGNTAERRRLRFVPNAVEVKPLKAEVLKDEFDEWLARIICYAFSLSPQALIKQMNRATSETAKQTAAEEGLEPLKNWWKDFVDAVLAKAFGAPELELSFKDEEISDPEIKAKVIVALAGGKPLITQDEGREKFGYAPMDDTQRLELQPPAPVEPAPDEADQAAAAARVKQDDEVKAELAELKKRADEIAADRALAKSVASAAETLGKALTQRQVPKVTTVELDRDESGALRTLKRTQN